MDARRQTGTHVLLTQHLQQQRLARRCGGMLHLVIVAALQLRDGAVVGVLSVNKFVPLVAEERQCRGQDRWGRLC